MKLSRIALLLLGGLLLAGCASTIVPGGNAIAQVHLFGMPVTLNLDSKPGPDGFAVRVYLTKPGDAKGAAIRNGSIEILMFDGVVGAAEILTATPQQSWKFTIPELRRLEEKSSLGHGYRFALRWTAPPKRGHITVVARYHPLKGESMLSAPSAISSVVK